MTIRLLAAFLLVVSAYLGWWSVSTASLFWFLPATVSLIAAVGLFLSKRWSQYVWHVGALVASLSWVVSIVRVALSGWPYHSTLSSIISLIPGLLLVAVCAGGSAVVANHFRANKNAS
jgi:hypothetical protein